MGGECDSIALQCFFVDILFVLDTLVMVLELNLIPRELNVMAVFFF